MIVHRSALFAALVATACAPRAAPAPAPPAPPLALPLAPLSVCDLPGDSTAHADTLTVAAPGAVDPAHAPMPVTSAERMLFRQLYETLLRVDCEGHLHPALAASWNSSDGGRTWTVTLADGAIFWDGVPVSARDVLAAWSPAINGVADSAAVTAERTLLVRLRRPSPDGPAAAAGPGRGPVPRDRPSPGRPGASRRPRGGAPRGAAVLVAELVLRGGHAPGVRLAPARKRDRVRPGGPRRARPRRPSGGALARRTGAPR